MKMHQDHLVPLSDRALAILDKMHDATQGELIFPNPDNGIFSENAMLAVLDRLGYGHVTVHGFRSTFATWAEECTDYPDGVREAALAHKYKSETTAAYQRGQKLEKRRAHERLGAISGWINRDPLSRSWLIYSHRIRRGELTRSWPITRWRDVTKATSALPRE
jgi:integrase